MIRRLLLLAIFLAPTILFAQKKDTAPLQIQSDVKPAQGGVYYADIVVGTGKAAERGMRVTVHYTGWLLSGKKFDSSVGGRPISFVLGAGDVIRGWDVGIEGMRVGGKRQLQIPDSMAYGPGGRPPAIPPNARLIFEVELLDATRK